MRLWLINRHAWRVSVYGRKGVPGQSLGSFLQCPARASLLGSLRSRRSFRRTAWKEVAQCQNLPGGERILPDLGMTGELRVQDADRTVGSCAFALASTMEPSYYR